MDEVGISLDGHRSKPLSEFLGKVTVQYVVFVCDRAEKACPHLWPFALQTDCWPFEDPASAAGDERNQRDKFRSIRDKIEEHILRWLESDAGTFESRLPRR